MPEASISDLFQVRNRFLRSAHLERDFADVSAMKGYVVTPHVRANIERLVSGLASNSGHRAWRITGDYGTGKSSFALALAHILSGPQDRLPAQLRHVVDLRQIATPRPRLLPVLVTGSREPIAAALLRTLQRAVKGTCDHPKRSRFTQRISALADTASRTSVPDAAIVSLLEEAGEYVRASGTWTGILIIVDELGKFLEFAAIHPDHQDVYFLQALAEAASRSGKTPLFVVGLLHQGFSAYADQLSQTSQREWEKVAGRFEELLFNQPLEQTVSLVADALNVRVERLPGNSARILESEMGTAVDLGWYGADAPRKYLLEHSARVYPLHPTVLPVLVRLFGRFGQNERSLFSFLFSEEPFSLRAFSAQPAAAESFYKLHHLYDYARTTFGHRLAIQSYRSHWNQIESVIESFRATDETELEVLKMIGVLNLVDMPTLMASEAAIMACLGGRTQSRRDRIQEAIVKLHKSRRVVYYRGEAGGYCLWPHTSVNLERAYEDARRALGSPGRISSLIERDLETRPIVARRHYIETGNLRHFEVRYSPVSELSSAMALDASKADGLILVPLCETPTERDAALDFARSDTAKKLPTVLVAVPKPLSSLAGLVQEARCWDWIGQNVPELNHDSYAAEEVSRQATASRQVLRKRLQAFVGLRQFTDRTELQWFWKGEPLVVNSGRDRLHAPHSLIAGSTGSGKSVLMQNILLGIAATNKPEQASIILIDPKQGVDYFAFEGLPHLEREVVVDRDAALHELQLLVGAMDKRYSLFRSAKVSSLSEYNRSVTPHDRLPVIWLVHDEFAEWMLIEDYREVVTSTVARLGVKARAAGIHLVFSAQRPDATVMPVQLRANLGNRLILKVDSEGTSEIALGDKGAERLLGHGHLLARLEGAGGSVYAQVPFVDAQFIRKMVEAIGFSCGR